MENVLPERLYVVMEDGGDGDYFPLSNTDLDGIDSGATVGIYERVDTKTLRRTTTLDLT